VLARRDLLLGLPLTLVLAARARAQASAPRVIGFLSPYAAADAEATLTVFRQAMRELGYVEGRNLVIVERFAGGRNERLPALAAELVQRPVDLILASTSNAVKAAQAATATIPIVFESVADPVAAGFADSIVRPGRNITGLSNLSADLSSKRFQYLTQMVPGLGRVAVLSNRSNPYYGVQKPLIEAVTDKLGLRVQFVDVSRAEEVDGAFQAIVDGRAEAVVGTADAYLYALRQRIVDLSLQHRLPSMFPFAAYVQAGGLMSYGVDPASGIRQASTLVDKIFKGAKPADLPIEQPTRVDLVLNRRTAALLRLTIPSELLLQARQVIDQ
jgi:putative ABC transport system substrate-binding protein